MYSETIKIITLIIGDKLAEHTLTSGSGSPPADSILRDGYSVSFADVLRIGYGQADNIVLGDSDHDDYRKIWGAMGESETVRAIAESGVSNMFLELPHFRNDLISEFQSQVRAGQDVDVAAFGQRFEHEDNVEFNKGRWRFGAQDETQQFVQGAVAPILETTAQAGVAVHPIDYENGADLLDDRNAARIALVETRDQILRLREAGNSLDPSVQTRLAELRSKFDQQKQDYMAAGLAYYNARHDDRNLAQTVNGISGGEKTLTLMGFVHGSRSNDFEEYLNGDSIKIDVAVSRAAYEQNYARQMDSLGAFNSDFGQDQPELVYLLDEGTVMTTDNTPAALIALLQDSSAPQIDQTAPSENTSAPTIDWGAGYSTKWN